MSQRLLNTFLTLTLGTFLHLDDVALKDLLLSGDVKVGTEALDIALDSMAKAP